MLTRNKIWIHLHRAAHTATKLIWICPQKYFRKTIAKFILTPSHSSMATPFRETETFLNCPDPAYQSLIVVAVFMLCGENCVDRVWPADQIRHATIANTCHHHSQMPFSTYFFSNQIKGLANHGFYLIFLQHSIFRAQHYLLAQIRLEGPCSKLYR